MKSGNLRNQDQM